MPSRADITYFGAGPAWLPTDVLEDAAQALVNYNDTGLGVAEHSHRSQLAADIINRAKADLAACLDIPDDYETIFMQGGGTGEFSAIAYNFVGAWVARKEKELQGKHKKTQSGAGPHPTVAQRLKMIVDRELKLDYIVTGGWSQKAAAEAERLFGPEHVHIAADGRQAPGSAGKFGFIPDESSWKLSSDSALVYFCANETVDGVEFPAELPSVLRSGGGGSDNGRDPIVVADMSSNILTRQINVRDYAAIFFGAQKNLGMAGITVVIIQKRFLPPMMTQPSPTLLRQLALPVPPIILQYETMAKNNSLYNTLSIFDIYVAGQVLKKMLQTYPDKLQGQQAITEQKAKIIYDALESFPEVYTIIPHKTARSRINICFRVTKGSDIDAAEKTFLHQASAQGLLGLKGHRSLGGVRASNYNTVSLEGTEKLAKFIRFFAAA